MRRLSWSVAVGAVAVALGARAPGSAPARTAAARSPRAGDYEVSGRGRVLSFQLVRAGGGLTVEDLVLSTAACLHSPGALYRFARVSRVSAAGTFGTYGSFLTGRFTTPDRALVRVVARYSHPRCNVDLRLPVTLTRRAQVRDGRWRGRSSRGDPIALTVSLGGRIAVIDRAQTTLDVCGIQGSQFMPQGSGGPLFISASGELIFPTLDYHLRFTSGDRAGGYYAIVGACAHHTPVRLAWVGP